MLLARRTRNGGTDEPLRGPIPPRSSLGKASRILPSQCIRLRMKRRFVRRALYVCARVRCL